VEIAGWAWRLQANAVVIARSFIEVVSLDMRAADATIQVGVTMASAQML